MHGTGRAVLGGLALPLTVCRSASHPHAPAERTGMHGHGGSVSRYGCPQPRHWWLEHQQRHDLEQPVSGCHVLYPVPADLGFLPLTMRFDPFAVHHKFGHPRRWTTKLVVRSPQHHSSPSRVSMRVPRAVRHAAFRLSSSATPLPAPSPQLRRASKVESDAPSR